MVGIVCCVQSCQTESFSMFPLQIKKICSSFRSNLSEHIEHPFDATLCRSHIFPTFLPICITFFSLLALLSIMFQIKLYLFIHWFNRCRRQTVYVWMCFWTSARIPGMKTLSLIILSLPYSGKSDKHYIQREITKNKKTTRTQTTQTDEAQNGVVAYFSWLLWRKIAKCIRTHSMLGVRQKE